MIPMTPTRRLPAWVAAVASILAATVGGGCGAKRPSPAPSACQTVFGYVGGEKMVFLQNENIQRILAA